MRNRMLLLMLLAAQVVFAQQGNYFLSHFSPSDERIDYVTFGMTQDAKGVIYFANKNGVLEFDGRNWGLIGTTGPVFTVAASGDDVFLGGLNGFGKIAIGPDNAPMFQTLSQNQPDATQIFSSLASKEKVYFSNAHAVYIVSKKTATVESVIKVKSGEEFAGLLDIAGNNYVKTTTGIYKLEGDKLAAPNFPWADNLTIEFSST